jgi:hypothetical protein
MLKAPEMKKLSFIIAMSLFSFKGFGQNIDLKLLCSGKWFPFKYEEADGTIVPVPKEQQSEYTEYKSDGTFYSMEGKAVIKGKWVYDPSAQTLTITQSTSKNYPGKLETKVVQLDNNNMIVVSEDAGGELVKIYLMHRK